MNYAIIGFGSAGYHALRKISELDPDAKIDIYSNTKMAPYNPMLTTYYVDSKINEEALFPFGSMDMIIQKYPFHLIQEDVIHISKDRIVETKNNKQYYDRILIATGARSFMPPINGKINVPIMGMRNVEDAKELKALLDSQKIKKAMVVGASMTGIKVTELLLHQNIEVTLIDLADHIFPLQAYEHVANAIEKRLEKYLINFQWNSSIDHIENNIVYLSNGQKEEVDLIALCIGTRSNVEIIKDTVSINKGIVVDQYLETSVSGIFGAGDCIEANNVQMNKTAINGLWANAAIQGTIAGRNMVKKEQIYDGNMFMNISHFLDHDFIGFGDIHAPGQILSYGNVNHGFYIQLVIDDHRIASGNIIDNYALSGILASYIFNLFMQRANPLLPFQKAMLVNSKLPLQFIEELEGMIYGTRSKD